MSERSPIHYDNPPQSNDFFNAGVEREIRDHCAVAGIIGPDVQYAGRFAYKMAEALQHRGQESSGVVLSNGDFFHPYKQTGLVKTVYQEGNVLNGMPADGAVVQNRYGTFSVGSAEDHMQPVTDKALSFTLVHNGNIANTEFLDKALDQFGISYEHLNDTERMHAVMDHYIKNGVSLEDAMARILPLAEGAASLIAMNREKMVAARDRNGIRPLAFGKHGDNVVFASETVALDEIGAEYLREVKPGEMIVADRRGIGSVTEHQVITDADGKAPRQRIDMMEPFYFMNPNGLLFGKRVRDIRRALGEQLFYESPKEGDLVIGVPDSAVDAAQAFAEAAGLEYAQAITKNKRRKDTDEEILRTFIMADQDARADQARQKYSIKEDLIKGRNLVVIDDSTVRGTTDRVLSALLWQAEPASIHRKNISPPFRYPEVHGLDVPDQNPLIAYGNSVEVVRQLINVTSMQYLSLEGSVNAMGKTVEDFSTGPFTGIYPTEIGRERRRQIDFNKYYFYGDLYAGPATMDKSREKGYELQFVADK